MVIRTIAFAFALLATTACAGNSARDGAKPGDPPPPTDCYPSTGFTAEGVPECGATKVCLTEDAGTVAIDDASCVKPNCRFAHAMSSGSISYDDGSTSMDLIFIPPVTNMTTAEELAALFEYVTFHVGFPIEPATERVDSAVYGEMRRGIEAFDTIELSGGRLHVRLVFTISSPNAYVYSEDPNCVTGDVGGFCACTFGGVAREGVIDIDLPVETI